MTVQIRSNLTILGFLLFAPTVWAQGNCEALTTQIFQRRGVVLTGNTLGCTFDSVDPELKQLERDAVASWLDLHRLRQSDSSIVYQYGRVDLRNQIRAAMFNELVRIISQDAASRTPNEQAVYKFVAERIHDLDYAQYSIAVDDANAWMKDPCGWRPDPDVAEATGVNYLPEAWCSGTPLITAFSSGPPVPTKDYFLAAALKKTYGVAITSQDVNQPYGPEAVQALQMNAYVMYGYAALPAAGLSTTAAALTYTFIESLIPGVSSTAEALASVAYLTTKRTAVQAGVAAAEEVAAAAAQRVAARAIAGIARLAASGPAVIILLAVELGVEAGFRFIGHDEAVRALNSLSADRENLQFSPPNLRDYLTNSIGLYKLQMAFTGLTLPEAPSNQPLPQHREGVDAYFVLRSPDGNNAEETRTLTYTDVAGTVWKIQSYGGWFLKSGELEDGSLANSISPTLSITDPNNVTWSVDRVGGNFLLTKTQPGENDAPCPANPITGVSNGSDVQTGACSSWVSSWFQLQDGTVVSLGQAPVFTSDAIAGVATEGDGFSVDVTTLAAPEAALSVGGSLPTGVTFTTAAPGRGKLSGTASVPPGNYMFQLIARNGSGTATQNFKLVVGTAVEIITPDKFSAPGGVSSAFTVRTTGKPAPKITLQNLPCPYSIYKPDPCPLLWQYTSTTPSGMTFRDNGDGSATFSGAYNGLSPTKVIVPGLSEDTLTVTVVADNGISKATQTLTINLSRANVAATVSPASATFTPGILNQFTIAATTPPVTFPGSYVFNADGSTPPASFEIRGLSTTSGRWLKFRDNGNSTATISGIPEPTASSYDVSFEVVTLPFGGGAGVPAQYTIHVNPSPVFLDDADHRIAVCDLGRECRIPVRTNLAAGTLKLRGRVPDGLTLRQDHGARTVIGDLVFMPTAGGAYPISVTADNSYGRATASYVFYIRSRPDFPSVGGSRQIDFWLMEGVQSSISIPTTGFPSDRSVTTTAGKELLPPMVVSLVDGRGPAKLPQGVSFTDKNRYGVPIGRGILSGAPAEGSAGEYRARLVANNGPSYSLDAYIRVRIPGDVNNDSKVDCQDLTALRTALGQRIGRTPYEARADLNNDGLIDSRDLSYVANIPTIAFCQ